MSQVIASPFLPSVLLCPPLQRELVSQPGLEKPQPANLSHSRLPSVAKPVSRKGYAMQESTPHQEDEALVARAQAGDAEAFDSLVLKHSSRIYGLVFHMTNNHEDTNDLLQDIWSKVFRSLAGFRGASKFSTWLHSIAVHMSINFLKRRGRRQALSLDAMDAEGNSPAETLLVSHQTPRREANLSELQAQLTLALAKLTPDHRAVVTMFDIQGMAHSEIAKILGTSEGTVRSRLFYAHRQLQNFLGEFRSNSSAS
jgi:RNA polymerase sigma-70 factor (ECF subfamily)